MVEPTWRTSLRTRWIAEYGDRFTADEFEQALDEVELFHRYAERIAKEPRNLGEMPFTCVLPPIHSRNRP